MAKATASVKFEFPDLEGIFREALPEIERTIAASIQTQVGMRFDAEGAYNGHEKWEPLKLREGQILSLRGDLRKSISPPTRGVAGPNGFVTFQGDVTNLLTEVGSKLIYAGVHNNGAHIVPKNKMALRFANPGTGKFIFSKCVNIPKRNFTDLNSTDEKELSETLANFIAERVLGGNK